MIVRAIKHASSKSPRSVVSRVFITNYISKNFQVSQRLMKSSIRRALQKGLESGKLYQIRQSFGLTKQREAVKSKKSKSEEAKIRKREKTAKRQQTERENVVAAKRGVSTTPSEGRTTKNSSKSAKKDSPSPIPKKPTPSSTTLPVKVKNVRKDSQSTSSSSSSQKEEEIVRVNGKTKYENVWQYYDNGWKNYELEASDVVEEVYQKYLQNKGDTDVRAVKSGQWEYLVDFVALKQTNIVHENHTVRKIRRVKISN